MVFTVSEAEFQFLRVFFELPQLAGFEALPTLEELTGLAKSLEGLVQKEYLHQDEEGKYFLEDELNFLLSVMKQADSAYVIEGRRKRFAAYFKEDAIVLFIMDEACQIMWLPFLPYLIGATASFLNPFLNSETEELERCTWEELDEVRKKWGESGYEKEWTFTFFQNGVKRIERIFEIYSNGTQQLLFRQEGEHIFVSAPNKADCVNAVTEVVARLHGNAIQKGENYERN